MEIMILSYHNGKTKENRYLGVRSEYISGIEVCAKDNDSKSNCIYGKA